MMNTQTSRTPVFLIGGGWNDASIKATYGAFIKRATSNGARKIAIILATENQDEMLQTELNYRAVFKQCGVKDQELVFFWGGPDKEIHFDDLINSTPTGLFVGGGTTPLYHNLLCKDLTWVDYIISKQIPYAGFSAGAAIAADNAILGGWKIQQGQREIEVLDEDLSEGLDPLTVRPGLGLVPFSVDVHASQWGTVTRLMHAVDLKMAPEGWAIDENTLLHIENDQLKVSGLGQAYHLQRESSATIMTKIYRSGLKFIDGHPEN